MPTKEAQLLELMRDDRLVLNKRQAEQGVVDREAAGEVVPAVRIECVSRRRTRGADSGRLNRFGESSGPSGLLLLPGLLAGVGTTCSGALAVVFAERIRQKPGAVSMRLPGLDGAAVRLADVGNDAVAKVHRPAFRWERTPTSSMTTMIATAIVVGSISRALSAWRSQNATDLSMCSTARLMSRCARPPTIARLKTSHGE